MAKKKVKKVRAVGTATVSGVAGEASSTSKAVTAAMGKAVESALADGISIKDSAEVRKRMMEARQRVLAGEE